MTKWLKKIKYVFYVKYVLGQCKHSCLLCKYRNECFDNIDLEYCERLGR